MLICGPPFRSHSMCQESVRYLQLSAYIHIQMKCISISRKVSSHIGSAGSNMGISLRDFFFRCSQHKYRWFLLMWHQCARCCRVTHHIYDSVQVNDSISVEHCVQVYSRAPFSSHFFNLNQSQLGTSKYYSFERTANGKCLQCATLIHLAAARIPSVLQ